VSQAPTGLAVRGEESFERFARMVRRQLGCPLALVSLVEGDRQILVAAQGVASPYDEACGFPLVVADARLDPVLRESRALRELGVVAYVGMPLVDDDGGVLGALCALDVVSREWTPGEIEGLRDLAAACSAELRLRVLAQAAADAQARAEAAGSRLALLAEVTRAVVSTLDVEEALHRLVRLLVPRTADVAWVDVVEGGDRVRRLAVAPSTAARAPADLLEVVAPGSPLSRVLHGGAGLLQVPTAELSGAPAGVPADGAAVLVALRARGDVLGVLTVLRRDPAGFSPLDEDFIAELVLRVSLAQENARLYAGQRRSSEVLQRSLLTRLPEPDHLHLVARYRPAQEQAQVGGDWYDAFLQPDGATVLVIGDVVGHDMSAAAAMGQLRNLLRGTAYDRQESPAGVLTRVDRAIRGLQVDTLATAIVARIEQTSAERARGLRRLRWSCAGHPPPLLLGPDGVVTTLDEGGDLLLGLDPGSARRDHEVELPSTSTLLLYTDGLVERRDSPLDHGLARLRQGLAALVDRPLEELCDELLARLLPSGAEDDVALIAVRMFPEDQPRPVEAGEQRVPPDVPAAP